ncbi:hypothetical protein N7520_002602 [Penicillium odoratum]|uniref:uncharacterized protein n=1 Tax=Penicillium odoratum TaxID=1167516 RepID=UPI0025487706|nr:uncharacterized protein N7520_002602 [Penicillium odoratum]KAJ5772073.1 hypothetical protein N7520_002602 [Penicillium odoratum]
MNPHISVPRQHAGPATFGSTPRRGSSVRMPRFFKRLFKFPQMDFEMAIWEMTSLLIAPKKVFKSIYYHKRESYHFNTYDPIDSSTELSIETKNTWHRPDPSFAYLLSFFLLLTALAWGLAYTHSFGAIVKLSILFIFFHFIGSSLLVSTIGYFIIGRLFGPNGAAASLAGFRGSRGRRRGAAQGLFVQPGEKDQLEFGYCFDVSNRAFFPLYLHLYVVQFLLLPLLTRSPSNFLATFLGNTLYLSALIYYTYITFLGYNALPFLHNTELLLIPILVFAIMWLISLIAGWGVVMQGRSVVGLFWGV